MVRLIPKNEGDEKVIQNIRAVTEENGLIPETFFELTAPFLNSRYGGARLLAWDYEPEYEGINWPREFVIKKLKKKK